MCRPGLERNASCPWSFCSTPASTRLAEPKPSDRCRAVGRVTRLLRTSPAEVEGGRMPGLVEAQPAAAGQRDTSREPPSFSGDGRAGDAFRGKRSNGRLEVVAHQVELVAVVLAGGMKGRFGGRQG